MEPATIQDENAMHALGQRQIVRRDQGGYTAMPDKLEQLMKHVRRGTGIEISGRLVGEQKLGGVRQRPRDRRALLLPARQLCRPVIQAMPKPQHAEQLLGPCFSRATSGAANKLRHQDVL